MLEFVTSGIWRRHISNCWRRKTTCSDSGFWCLLSKKQFCLQVTKFCLGTLATARGTSLLGWNWSAKRAAVYAKKHWAPRRKTVSTCTRTAAGDGNRKGSAIIRRNRYSGKLFQIFTIFRSWKPSSELNAKRAAVSAILKWTTNPLR